MYDKEVPFEMRLQESDEAPQEVGTLEAIRCKVCVQGEAGSPVAVRLELSSEQDLFFHYTHVIEERSFRSVREEQRLMIEFQDYPVRGRALALPRVCWWTTLRQRFTRAHPPSHPALCCTECPRAELEPGHQGAPHAPRCLHHEPRRQCAPRLHPGARRGEQRVQPAGSPLAPAVRAGPPSLHATHTVWRRAPSPPPAPSQNLEYKFVELLSVSFLRSPEAAVREHIGFRYQAVRAKLSLVQARLNEVTNIVKVRLFERVIGCFPVGVLKPPPLSPPPPPCPPLHLSRR